MKIRFKILQKSLPLSVQERTLPVHIDKVCLCQKETLSFGGELVFSDHFYDFDLFEDSGL